MELYDKVDSDVEFDKGPMNLWGNYKKFYMIPLISSLLILGQIGG